MTLKARDGRQLRLRATRHKLILQVGQRFPTSIPGEWWMKWRDATSEDLVSLDIAEPNGGSYD